MELFQIIPFSMSSENIKDNMGLQSLADDNYQSYIQQPVHHFRRSNNIEQETEQSQFHTLEIKLSAKNLTDEDVHYMVEKQQISTRTTLIDLSGNKITHYGAHLIADVFKKSEVRDVK